MDASQMQPGTPVGAESDLSSDSFIEIGDFKNEHHSRVFGARGIAMLHDPNRSGSCIFLA